MTRRRIVGARPSGRRNQFGPMVAAIGRPPGRAPTVAIAILAMANAAAAVAQQTVIDRCKQTSSDADRIACLEAALLGKEVVAAKEAEEQIDPPSMEQNAGPQVEETPATMAVAAAVPVEEAPAERTPEPPVAPAPEGIGAEQVIARNQSAQGGQREPEQVRNLRVAGYDKVPYERLVVLLENGQVWRQIKGDTQRIRVNLKRNQTVDISEASMSGYKLRLNEIRRTIRVERVR